METSTLTYFEIPSAPAIPGLRFRHYAGESDLPRILAVVNAAHAADKDMDRESLETLTNNYRHLTNCDPFTDMIIAEVDGEIAAYGRVSWVQPEDIAERILHHFFYVHPEQRGRGLEQTICRHNEHRLAEIAAGFPAGTACLFQIETSSRTPYLLELIQQEGYETARVAYMMECADLSAIPDAPLPEGLQVRPVLPEHIRPIWDAMQEAFSDHWGFVQPSEEDYQKWLISNEYCPDVWQVAWDGDQVAGMVLNYYARLENGQVDLTKGWTENISVRRPWRRRGVARALLARSMQMWRDKGCSKTMLGVDSLNPNQAGALYRSMGYQVVDEFYILRKPLA